MHSVHICRFLRSGVWYDHDGFANCCYRYGSAPRERGTAGSAFSWIVGTAGVECLATSLEMSCNTVSAPLLYSCAFLTFRAQLCTRGVGIGFILCFLEKSCHFEWCRHLFEANPCACSNYIWAQFACIEARRRYPKVQLFSTVCQCALREFVYMHWEYWSVSTVEPR